MSCMWHCVVSHCRNIRMNVHTVFKIEVFLLFPSYLSIWCDTFAVCLLVIELVFKNMYVS